MQAATVELLTRKAKFPSEQALAVAEAIDMAVADPQRVTIPILDARFEAQQARVDARFADLGAKMDAGFAAVDARFADFGARMDAGFGAVDARFADFGAKVDARFAKVDARFVVFEAKMEARFAAVEARLDRFRLQIIITILIGHVALGPVGMAIVEAIRRAF